MPDISAYHPAIIHFTIALLVVGVIFRLISLTGRFAFTGPAAVVLILTGTLASVLAVKSGVDAHGPAERIPGARAAVVEHEEGGERARNVFLGVALIEVLALLLASRGNARIAYFASGLVGLVGLFFIYEAAEHGGELVYSYAGGVGVSSGEPEDVGRLLLAGLYHQAQLDRQSGNTDEAAALIEMALRRFPSDIEVQLLAAESLLLDQQNPSAALVALEDIKIPEGEQRLHFRHGWLMADIFEANGQKEAARDVLESLKSEFPNSTRLLRRLEESEGQ